MRHSVIIRPSSSAGAEIDRWRARYDAHYKLIGPHLTVAFPDNIQTSPERVKDHLASTASRFQPFEVSFSRWAGATDLLQSHPDQTRFLLERYPNSINMLVLLVAGGASESLAIRRSARLVIPQPDPILEYPPYVAIGQTLSDSDYEAARVELAGYQPQAQFTATEIELLAEQPGGSWDVVGKFRLGAENEQKNQEEG